MYAHLVVSWPLAFFRLELIQDEALTAPFNIACSALRKDLGRAEDNAALS
jgi:hypothetical protein